MTLLCTRDLFKSTYQGLAFKRGRRYEVVRDEGDLVWVADETGRPFSFTRGGEAGLGLYLLRAFFEEV